MEKMRMETESLVDENIKKLMELFPSIVTETVKDGKVARAVDFDALKQELSDVVVEGNEERYQFTWPDKRKARLLANTPVRATLRPCKEESVDFDTTKNLYIEGDNLDVLKLLRETYLGKIKMIYLDPPYNTGKDFVYSDYFAMSTEEYNKISGEYDEQGNRLIQNTSTNGRFHTDWLNMLYPRLKIAKDLLAEDGVLFVSIDDNEVKNLRNMCDEIFGEQNFVTMFVWHSTAGSNTGSSIVTSTEYILCYGRNKRNIPFKSMMKNGNWRYEDEYLEERGRYELQKLDGIFTSNHFSPSLVFPIKLPNGELIYPGGGSQPSDSLWNWRWSQTKVEWGIKNGYIAFVERDKQWTVYFKNYEKVDNRGEERKGSVPHKNLIGSEVATTATGTQEINSLFGRQVFEFPKASELIKHFISMLDMPNDSIILDFFSGSATTAHAVMQLNAEDGGNRKFIMVQLPEVCVESSEAYKAGYKTICKIGEERIRRAGKKIKEGSGPTTQNLDTGFRVLKLDSSNMRDVWYKPDEISQQSIEDTLSNVKEDRTPMDLLFQVMLENDALLSSKIDEKVIEGKKVFVVNDNDIVCCFDSDIGDDVVKAIAQMKPLYAVFRDSSFKSDDTMVNAEQYFKTYSPNTELSII